jgi:hypothetical protein
MAKKNQVRPVGNAKKAKWLADQAVALMEEREAKIGAVEEALGNNRKLRKKGGQTPKGVFPMKAPCTLTHLRNGIWLVHHTSPALGTVGVSANAREEALTKMQNILTGFCLSATSFAGGETWWPVFSPFAFRSVPLPALHSK